MQRILLLQGGGDVSVGFDNFLSVFTIVQENPADGVVFMELFSKCIDNVLIVLIDMYLQLYCRKCVLHISIRYYKNDSLNNQFTIFYHKIEIGNSKNVLNILPHLKKTNIMEYSVKISGLCDYFSAEFQESKIIRNFNRCKQVRFFRLL